MSKKENQIHNVISDYGKIPPQALELEEAVLGAIMLEKDALLTIIDILRPEMFYNEANQRIYNAAIMLSSECKPIDILTITEKLRIAGELDLIGGRFYITQCTSAVASAAHIEYHARIIAQKFIQRELIRISSEIQNRSFDEFEDVQDILEFAEMQLFGISQGAIKKDIVKINRPYIEVIKKIDEIRKQEIGLIGLPSGFTQIDRITSGWQNSDLIIIAGRPSMGKTAFALNIARNLAIDHSKSVAIFSLEMSTHQLTNRLIISESGIEGDIVRSGQLSDEKFEYLQNKTRNIEAAPLYIDDTAAISIMELRAKSRRLRMKHGIELIIVDYLQLIRPDKSNRASREQEVSSITQSLKAIAKELDIPVIALSQLNRSIETRGGNKRPQLSDLRESGAIEQEADIVIFIHRPERYGITEDEEGYSLRGLAEIIIAKHRNGSVGDVDMRFESKIAKFSDLNERIKTEDIDNEYWFDKEPEENKSGLCELPF
uniref:DNA 5'-3' helicase n=1 Tax=viral metagenome TaxID=1070528 RepID=A0A6M3J3I0_9ZZZZ